MKKDRLHIGCHLSSSKGFYAMGRTALEIGADTFQFFTRNPRGSKAKAIDHKDIETFAEFAQTNQFTTILAHAPYTLNAASKEERVREFALLTMKDDLSRMEFLQGNFYNFHPGSHGGHGITQGIHLISDLLNQIMYPEMSTTILLETMAGKGNEVGSRFEEVREIMDHCELSQHIGVCLDTCHVYDAGYDIVNDLDGVLELFEQIIGIEKLKAIHLNDSKNPMSSHKDRHEKIGEGSIGVDAIRRIINHPKIKHLPFYLETPNEIPGYEQEIKLLKELWK
ncbi:MAG: deoxyribonuclease IV [Lachnospiraceae bacterium]